MLHSDSKPATGYVNIQPAGGDTATPLNLAKRLRLMERYTDVRGKRVLDCGCGAGDYVTALLEVGADAWGIEYAREKVASSHSSVTGRLSVGDLGEIAVGDAAFDVALLNEVLEHVPDDRRVLRELWRILRPGGTLIIFSPNRRYPFETHGAKLRRSGRKVPHYIPLIPYIPLALASTVIEPWARNYWPGELRRLIKAAGFTISHTDYVWQTFEGISRHQPPLITYLRPVLRRAAGALEQIPVVRSLGVSQVIIATK
jgi:ubiquinone/menaquinone biosynthesis C-methylase UbiE